MLLLMDVLANHTVFELVTLFFCFCPTTFTIVFKDENTNAHSHVVTYSIVLNTIFSSLPVSLNLLFPLAISENLKVVEVCVTHGDHHLA
jgi:hypothetical protein